MTAGSRFRSPRVQDAVVAATMFVLLLGSVVLASQLSAARAPQSTPIVLREVTKDELRFQLPSTWEQVQSSNSRRSGASVWADSNRPSRRLGLVRVPATQAVDPRIVMGRYLPMFMGSRIAREVQTVDAAAYPHPQLKVFEWAGASSATSTEPRLHLAADLTDDDQTHYLFYLTDEVQAEENGRDVLLRNLALLRAVHQSARLTTLAEAP